MADAGQAESGEGRADGAGLPTMGDVVLCEMKISADDGKQVAVVLVTYQL